MSAANDLLQLQQHPNFYDGDILAKAEAVIQALDDRDSLRQEFGWEPDEDQWLAPDPLHPGELMPEDEWEDTTGIPLPEDMTEDDKMILELMQLFGQESDPYSGVAAVFDRMKRWAKGGVFQ